MIFPDADNREISTPPELSVIIVSYNTREMTLKCLRTLFERAADVALEVWVVDNASRDGSVEAIQREFSHVQIIENPKNSGFGAANNLAMKQARGTYFLLLNSDAFVHEGALQTLIEYSKSHPQVGVVGPRLLNDDGSLQRSCFRFPNPTQAWLENLWISNLLPPASKFGDYRRWAHDEERTVDWVIGACLLVRRDMFETVGGFDESFFMYAEETDWQRSIRSRGWEVAFVPSAVVTHLGGASGANADDADERTKMSESFFQSLDFYEWKHHGWAGLVSLRAAMTVGCLLRGVLWSALALVPSRRKKARSRAKMRARLVVRQMTNWNLPLRKRA